MESKDNTGLFNGIASIYGLFYRRQKKGFRKVIERFLNVFDASRFKTVLDVGCGTGALCAVLCEKGFEVTGIDPAENMLRIAKKNPKMSPFVSSKQTFWQVCPSMTKPSIFPSLLMLHTVSNPM
ncbi:MAG TPA: class I SAM-dependent methyltransferase, partial [Thermotogota bacterium]|nr:class I SAM-dependent methyltransferase [Thermotogota bacterium]